MIMKSVVVIIHLVEFDIYSLGLEYVSDHKINKIYNSRIEEVILIGNNTTLLDYEY